MIDAIYVLSIGTILFWNDPFLAVVVILSALLFYFQLGKTVLLLGVKKQVIPMKRMLRFAVIAAVFCSPLLTLFYRAEPKSASGLAELSWGDDLFPMFLAVCLLISVLMITLLNEKRRR